MIENIKGFKKDVELKKDVRKLKMILIELRILEDEKCPDVKIIEKFRNLIKVEKKYADGNLI